MLCSTIQLKKQTNKQTESIAQDKKNEKTENNIIFHSEYHDKITLQYFFSKYTFIKVSLLMEYFTLRIFYSPKKNHIQKLF